MGTLTSFLDEQVPCFTTRSKTSAVYTGTKGLTSKEDATHFKYFCYDNINVRYVVKSEKVFMVC